MAHKAKFTRFCTVNDIFCKKVDSQKVGLKCLFLHFLFHAKELANLLVWDLIFLYQHINFNWSPPKPQKPIFPQIWAFGSVLWVSNFVHSLCAYFISLPEKLEFWTEACSCLTALVPVISCNINRFNWFVVRCSWSRKPKRVSAFYPIKIWWKLAENQYNQYNVGEP